MRAVKMVWIAGAAWILAGCRTVPDGPAVVTPMPEPAPNPIAPTQVVIAVPAPPPHHRPPPWSTNSLFEPWVALEDVAQYFGAPKPEPLSSLSQNTYALQASNGLMQVTVGSRLAHWCGLECWLGFAPRMIQGQPWVHRLDAEKTIQPLMGQVEPVLFGSHRVLVIDPGHGGENTGTKSAFNGRNEKEYTLDWARRLQSLLETNGWTVLLTRTNDADVSLSERVEFAEHARADLFLSLHFNATGSGGDHQGIETYCLTPSGQPSSLTRNFEDDPMEVLPNNAFDAQNLRYAVRLHQSLLGVTGAADRGIRRARFMGVLRGQNRPAVLLEGGYLSNVQEAGRIDLAEHRQKLAEALAQALE